MPKRTAEGQANIDRLAHELFERYFAGRSAEEVMRIKACLEAAFPRQSAKGAKGR